MVQSQYMNTIQYVQAHWQMHFECVPEPSRLTIALRHRSRVHVCISKGNYRKFSCLGEHNTQGTSPPWFNKQGNYRFGL